MDKRFLLIIAALVIIFGAIFWFTKSKSTSPGNTSGDTTAGTNHVIGNNTTGVTLVEFGDYQCPACYQYYPLVKQVQEKYNDQIAFQFRNFPLVQRHSNAMIAARAAEAAGMQNKFWEMHDMLFQNQQNWAEASNAGTYFEQFAEQLGLDLNKFKEDMNSAVVLEAINADVAAAQALGATGTPVFAINGKKIDPLPKSIDEFSKLIDAAIAQNANQQ